MNDEAVWQETWENLDRLRATVDREMRDWTRIQEQMQALYLRAHRDPEAARTIAEIEHCIAARFTDGGDVRTSAERLQTLFEQMKASFEQDRRELQQQLKSMPGQPVKEEERPGNPPTGRRTPTPRKRVRRYA